MRGEYFAAYREANRDKIRERQRAYRAAHPEKARASNARWNAKNGASYKRIRTYGTDGAAEYTAQAGKCGACAVDLETLPQKLRHLDHDHTTGRVRGWLCHACNTALGLLQDSAERCDAAAAYLRKGTENV